MADWSLFLLLLRVTSACVRRDVAWAAQRSPFWPRGTARSTDEKRKKGQKAEHDAGTSEKKSRARMLSGLFSFFSFFLLRSRGAMADRPEIKDGVAPAADNFLGREQGAISFFFGKKKKKREKAHYRSGAMVEGVAGHALKPTPHRGKGRLCAWADKGDNAPVCPAKVQGDSTRSVIPLGGSLSTALLEHRLHVHRRSTQNRTDAKKEAVLLSLGKKNPRGLRHANTHDRPAVPKRNSRRPLHKKKRQSAAP